MLQFSSKISCPPVVASSSTYVGKVTNSGVALMVQLSIQQSAGFRPRPIMLDSLPIMLCFSAQIFDLLAIAPVLLIG